MRSRQSLVLDTARHVQTFLDDNAALIVPSIASSRRNLDDVVAQLSVMAVPQSSGKIASRGSTARQRSLLTSLRTNHMQPTALVARQKLKDVPESYSLTMPAQKLGGSQLVAAVTAMADAAKPHEAVLTEVGFPDDFIAELHATADAVTTSIAGRQHQVAQSSGAVAEHERDFVQVHLCDRPRAGQRARTGVTAGINRHRNYTNDVHDTHCTNGTHGVINAADSRARTGGPAGPVSTHHASA